MTSKTFRFKAVNDDPSDFRRLFKAYSLLKEHEYNARIDFSQCNFLRQNAAAFFGGMARVAEMRGGKVEFLWKTLDIDVYTNLQYNGFSKAHGGENILSIGTSIPYKESIKKDKNELLPYLREYWLGRGWVNIPSSTKNLITGKVWEIYENAFDHSGSPVGVFSCGQYFQRRKELKLSVIDFGVGIPFNVRAFMTRRLEEMHRQKKLEEKFLPLMQDFGKYFPADRALEWAMEMGHSTRSAQAGGIGLDELRTFVKEYKGKLEIYSDNGYVFIDTDQESYTLISEKFEGTVVNITLPTRDND